MNAGLRHFNIGFSFEAWEICPHFIHLTQTKKFSRSPKLFLEWLHWILRRRGETLDIKKHPIHHPLLFFSSIFQQHLNIFTILGSNEPKASACVLTPAPTQNYRYSRRLKKKKSRDIFILLGAGYISTINVPSSTHSPFGKVITVINKAVALCTTKPFVKEGKDWESITQPILTGAQTIHQTVKALLLFHLFVSRLLLHVSLCFFFFFFFFFLNVSPSRQAVESHNHPNKFQLHLSQAMHLTVRDTRTWLHCSLTMSRVDVLI